MYIDQFFFPKKNLECWQLQRQMKIPVEVSPRPPFDELETWKRANLDANLLDALLQKGFARPSASQRWAVPLLLTGKDVMLCSQTGVERKLVFVLVMEFIGHSHQFLND